MGKKWGKGGKSSLFGGFFDFKNKWHWAIFLNFQNQLRMAWRKFEKIYNYLRTLWGPQSTPKLSNVF